MVQKPNVQQLLNKYTNTKAELEIAYSYGLDYSIVSSLHRDLDNLKKLFSRLGVNPDENLKL